MPYKLDDTNEPVSGVSPVQVQAKAASPDKLEIVQPINFTEAKAAFMRYPETVDAFLQAAQNSPEALPGIIDLAKAVVSEPYWIALPLRSETRYLSLTSSTCKVCRYIEEIEIPEDAEPEAIMELFGLLMKPCPECEAALQAQTARADLEMYDQGLELLEDE